MTEKRFTIADYPTDIIDNQSGKKYPCSSYGTHMEIICDLLNDLTEENVKLQARNKYLAMKIQRERASTMKQYEKWENEAITEIEKIKQQRDFYYARLQKIIRIANGDLE